MNEFFLIPEKVSYNIDDLHLQSFDKGLKYLLIYNYII